MLYTHSQNKVFQFFVCSIMTSQWSKAVFLRFYSYLLGYWTKILKIKHEDVLWYILNLHPHKFDVPRLV